MSHQEVFAEQMLALAESFPTLRGVLRAWDPTALDRWALLPSHGAGAFNAARFVLSVYNPRADWKCGHFDVHLALWSWDAEHHAAFAAWVQKPWWP